MATQEKTRGGIQSLERAAALLDAVAAAGPDGITAAALAERTGLNASTAFHLIKMLESLGFLARPGESKRYLIGSRLFGLAAGAMGQTALLTLGTPVLERLSQQTGETAHLAVRSQAAIIVIARTAATGLLQLSDQVGVARPAHATAIGKVLLAQASAEELNRLLPLLRLERFTDATITSVGALRDELRAVRVAGEAHDRGELDPEVRCVAAPVWDFSGRCVAALGFSGPVWRMGPEAIPEKVRLMHAAARGLSAALGHAPAPD